MPLSLNNAVNAEEIAGTSKPVTEKDGKLVLETEDLDALGGLQRVLQKSEV